MKKLLYTPFILFILFVLPFYGQNKQEEHNNSIDVNLLDSAVPPETDFYAHVNGKWLENTDIPTGRSSWGNFDEINKKINQNILLALNKAKKEKTYEKETDQYKTLMFYDLAMDTIHLNKLGYNPLKPTLKQIMSIKNNKGIQDYLQDATLKGIRGFFDLEVYPDLKNSSVNALYIVPGTQGLPNKDYYMKDDEESVTLREKYKTHIDKMFQLVGYSPSEAKVKAENALQIETKLAVPMMSETEKRNPISLYNKRSVSQLTEMTPSIKWNSYFESSGIKGIDSVIVFEPKYMEEVGNVLSKNNITSLKDYLEWHALHHAANYMSSEFSEANHEFYGKTLWGIAEMKPRWETVLEVCNNNLGEAVGKVYVDEFFPPEAKDRSIEMVNNILAAFKKRIENLDWMTEPTKQQALGKLNALQIKIGYPDKWKSYSNLAVKSQKEGGSYLENMQAASLWKLQEKIEKIGKKVDKTEWFLAPQTINAYYSPIFNEIVFTAGMLQPPFFNFTADDAVNYGAIGAIIGHEVTHGFDDIGSLFDAEGNMKDWWSPQDREAFNSKKQLIIDQFSAYEPLPGLKINGALTVGENISDLSGLSVSYDAFTGQLKKTGNTESIDGLIPEQRFYISYVTMLREKQKEEALKVSLSNNPHSPGKYRAIGTIQNQESFYRAFKIEEGHPMFKPEQDRIKIW